MIEGDSWRVLLGSQPVSALSHLVAALVALSAATSLVRLGAGHPGRRLALGVYAGTVVLALAISGIYHSLEPGSAAREIMRKVDHCTIWCLIAGTFTAVHGVMWKGFWCRGILAFIWAYAAVGILIQLLWFRALVGNTELVLYLGLGWVGLLTCHRLGRQIGWVSALPMLYAGVAYSAGAVLEAHKWPVIVERWVESHELFHFAVIVGVALHWRFIRRLSVHHAPRFAAVPVAFSFEGAPATAAVSSSPPA